MPRIRRTILAAALAIGIPITAVAVAALPSEAATLPAAGGVYQLAVTKSGMCIDVTAGSKDNGALLQQWGCTSGATWQQFKLTAVSSTQYQLVNVSSGRCVDVPGGSKTSGVQLQQWGCAAQTNQYFTLAASGTNTFQIVNVNSGLCLSDQGASTSSGAAIIQETCTANTNKQWAFTAVSSGTATVAADGTGTYRTIQAAVDAVPANNAARRTITIKAGSYREIVTIPSNKPYITLQGLGSSASQTVIVNNHSSAGGYGTSGSATVFVNGHDFVATNLTMSNDYGEGSQAVAANVNADRSVFSNVRFLGNQDTLLVNAYRSYYTGSYVEGTVDFIFGGGTAVFNASSIYERRSTGGPITASRTDAANAYGFLFYKCTITGATNNTTQLGRPWGPDAQVLYRESSLSATIATGQPWIDMSGNSWKNARFFEYKNTGSGATTNGNRPQMSDSTAASYTPQKYLTGTDGWNPL
ncbi:pectinesterase family protein [Paractinoplanes globisporus]|uniref:Pectinesterase n=1 Tax=Paractinoplanes globisporus TaxID=113565 RepID=A0ABW6WCZ4_9ACTN|nr:pectinesterase family protein [Actinoplanes globisporus]